VSEFDDLVAEAMAAPVAGWDFSWMQGRSAARPPPWSYEQIVAGRAAGARAMLDMGTGGGEVLAGLAATAPVTIATEAWAPNVPVATERLAPLGIAVVQVDGAPDNIDQPGDGGELPFDDQAFDLVINRHEAFVAAEVARVLEPGGTFVTQQVDGGAWDDLLAAFGQPRQAAGSWLGLAIEQCGSAGLRVLESRTGDERLRFDDVGALVYFLRVVSWAVPGVDGEDSEASLRRAHARMPLEIRQPRFLLIAGRAPDRNTRRAKRRVSAQTAAERR
jgi:SAM-dependent methyltransferase